MGRIISEKISKKIEELNIVKPTRSKRYILLFLVTAEYMLFPIAYGTFPA